MPQLRDRQRLRGDQQGAQLRGPQSAARAAGQGARPDENHQSFDLDLTQLPGIKDDPLAALRKGAVDWDVQTRHAQGAPPRNRTKAPAVREVSVNNWPSATMATAGGAVHRQRLQGPLARQRGLRQESPWSLRSASATRPGSTGPSTTSAGCMTATSSGTCPEVDGWSHLYVKDLNAKAPRLISKGDFEINPNLFLSRDRQVLLRQRQQEQPRQLGDLPHRCRQRVTCRRSPAWAAFNGAQPGRCTTAESFQLAPDERQAHGLSLH